MGAGKTTLAEILSARTEKPVISTDALIVEQQGKPITAIFSEDGEPFFRACERKVVQEVSQKDGVIIDCGGGIVLNPENLADLRQRGVIFYLSATADVIYARIKDQQHRPLLNTPHPRDKIDELLEKRLAFYEQADHIIDTNDNDWKRMAEEMMDVMRMQTP